jgi:peptidoglycan-associated lipoprotein
VARAEIRDIHFDFDRSAIRPDAARILDATAAWLRSNAGFAVLVEGHCDERGTNEYNLALGERRARAAVDYLVRRGVARDRFRTISYGEERSVCTERGEACWRQNRRAHFLVKGG